MNDSRADKDGVLNRKYGSSGITWLEAAIEFAEETVEGGPTTVISADCANAVAQVVLALVEERKARSSDDAQKVKRLLEVMECDDLDSAILQAEFDVKESIAAALAIKKAAGHPEQVWPSPHERRFFIALKESLAPSAIAPRHHDADIQELMTPRSNTAPRHHDSDIEELMKPALSQRLRDACAECKPSDGLGTRFSTFTLDDSRSYGERLVAVALEAADALEAQCSATTPACQPGCPHNAGCRPSDSRAASGERQ